MVKKIIILFVSFLLIVFIVSYIAIYNHVKNTCFNAKKIYGQDCVTSLIKIIQSDKASLREKNSAVWALGQLADTRALPFLYELNKTTPKQDRCGYDSYLCKYEVEKAVKWCENGNATSWMYYKLR